MTKLEELAGIIADRICGGETWADPRNGEPWRSLYRETVVLVLKAMREPSEAQRACGLMAGWSGVIEGIPEDEKDAAADLWRRMIDALLSESPG